MLDIGINGFGRIGKCIFLQLINNPFIRVRAINAPDFKISTIESYLKRDSAHLYSRDFNVEIIDENTIEINKNKITLLNDRNAENLDWRSFKIKYIIDSTGVYLTKEKASKHDVDYIIMSAPAKDDTPLYVYGANHDNYLGENIVSNASCTTNCIVPVLRHFIDTFGIHSANFTTIHASTASQKVVDTAHSKSRTSRSIFNNIIPHTTGASSSINKIFPSLKGKIHGTSVRVPVNNVSLVDMNIKLEKETNIDELIKSMESNKFLSVINENIVSSDLMTTTCPSIIDSKTIMELGDNTFKIMIWYDNEWSYAAQTIKLLEKMQQYNNRSPRYIENNNFHSKDVILRLDLNTPMYDENNKIRDDYRIRSSIPTILRILKDKPNRVIMMSHFGRPKGYEEKYSLKHIVEHMSRLLNKEITFLEKGLSYETIKYLNERTPEINKLYLLENLRFHPEETKYRSYCMRENEAIRVFNSIGEIYVNDAFGCSHRDHLSITGSTLTEKVYGYLIKKETSILNLITQNKNNEKILAIIGGGKMDDKLKLLHNLSHKVNHIYIAGGNVNSIIKNNMDEYLEQISSNKAEITIMKDGLSSDTFLGIPEYSYTSELKETNSFYDIGMKSINELSQLIHEHDIIFWNGTLGVVENELYVEGSRMLVDILMKESANKKIIIGGGDTGGFVNKFNHNFTHVSTGGGASIEYITDNDLIGLSVFH